MKYYEANIWEKGNPRKLSPATEATFLSGYLLILKETAEQGFPQTHKPEKTEKQILFSIKKEKS